MVSRLELRRGRRVGRPRRGKVQENGMAGICGFLDPFKQPFCCFFASFCSTKTLSWHGELVKNAMACWLVGWIVCLGEGKIRCFGMLGWGVVPTKKQTCPLKNSGWKTSLFF